MSTDVLLSGSNGKTVRGLVGWIYGIYICLLFVLHKVWTVMVEMVSFLFVRSVWETEVVSLVEG